MPTSFLLILVACALYGGLHSWLASLRVKRWAAERMGPAGERCYRLFFNIQGAVTALPLLALAGLLPDARLYTIPFPWVLLTLALQGLGVAGLVAGVLQTGALAFLGLDALLPGRPAQPARLVTGGLYRWMRHPLYSFGLLILWALPAMTWNRLALALGLTIYILVGIYFEERKLLREFGPAYAEYRRRTPMLIPGIF
jgi:protein-S-isoprenylcysteine O-methyltransferase Ste14